MHTPVISTAVALRAALAQVIACSAQELQEAIGQVVVATAAELPVETDSPERSVYDADTRTMVLLADRIPAGLERQAVVGEMLRQHGRRVAEVVVGKLPEPTSLEAGDKVFVLAEQCLGTVLNVYGDGLNGYHGDVRVDVSGNTQIDALEPYDPALHAMYDDTFVPIKAEWKVSYGITQDVPLRSEEVDPLIKVQLRDSEGNDEVVEFNASDVLKHNEEARSWAEVGRDEAAQHAQMSWAEDYALYAFKRKFGDMDEYEVTVLEGLSELDESLDEVAPTVLVDASSFHSMRGHAAEGTRVRFSSGEELTVRSAMRGWNLESDDGKVSLGPFDGAMALTSAIVQRDNGLVRDVSPSPGF